MLPLACIVRLPLGPTTSTTVCLSPSCPPHSRASPLPHKVAVTDAPVTRSTAALPSHPPLGFHPAVRCKLPSPSSLLESASYCRSSRSPQPGARRKQRSQRLPVRYTEVAGQSLPSRATHLAAGCNHTSESVERVTQPAAGRQYARLAMQAAFLPCYS